MFRQKIIIIVTTPYQEAVTANLTGYITSRSSTDFIFEWHRQSMRRGDDETILYDLYTILQDVPIECITIDWSASDY